MQQRVPIVSTPPNLNELRRMGSQDLWDLAKGNCQNEAFLRVVRDILYPRRPRLAASAVRWIDDQLALLRSVPQNEPICEPTKRDRPRWGLAAALIAGILAISGGIAHGAGVSIWHELIKPLFIGG
jgi:hypothetical protein